MSEFDPDAGARQPWNIEQKVGAKRALKSRLVWAIRFFLNQHSRIRDRALFDLAIDSKLRGCDVVRTKVGEIVLGAQARSRAIVVQAKTVKPVQFELMADARTGSDRARLQPPTGYSLAPLWTERGTNSIGLPA